MQHMAGGGNSKQDDSFKKDGGATPVDPEFAQDERYKNLDPKVSKEYFKDFIDGRTDRK
jgi:hypothetical protein